MLAIGLGRKLEFHFFEQVLVILGVSLLVAVVFSRLRLPSIIAYMVAGGIIGPYCFAWVDPSAFTLIAEFGVVFLLFSLGLEFSLPRMIALRGPVFGLGGAQVFFTSVVFAGAAYLWGSTIEAAIVIAGALALSSTAIVTRELAARQQFGSRYAQLAVAVLLFQDLFAVVFLILVPVFGGSGEGSLFAELGSALGKGALLLVALMAIGKWVLPRIYHEVARTRSDDVFVLTTLLIALLAAWLTHSFEMSMALGGFIIGMMLGEGPFRHRIDAEIRPFKDILLGLFFVTIGMSVDLSVVADYWLRIALFTMALVAINVTVLTGIARALGEAKGDALRVGLTLAQAGEFGLALLVVARLNDVIPIDQTSFIIAIAVLSMFISPLLIRHVDAIANALSRAWPGEQTTSNEVEIVPLPANEHVIIGGFGRVGATVAAVLEANDIEFVGIESDTDVVRDARLNGLPVVYGDCSESAILEQCGIDRARLALLTFRSSEYAKQTISRIREDGITTPIIVRCYENDQFEELISLGADHVVPEMLEASLVISAHVLSFLGLEEVEINRQLNELRFDG